jgi:hypothetical protein
VGQRTASSKGIVLAWISALVPFDSGENAINPNARILKISKQIGDRYPFTINADQTEIYFTLNQNIRTSRKLIYRLLTFRSSAEIVFLLFEHTSRPLRH